MGLACNVQIDLAPRDVSSQVAEGNVSQRLYRTQIAEVPEAQVAATMKNVAGAPLFPIGSEQLLFLDAGASASAQRRHRQDPAGHFKLVEVGRGA